MPRPRDLQSLERPALDTLPITVYTVDLDGRVVFANRSGVSSGVRTGPSNAPTGDAERGIARASIWDIMAAPEARAQVEQAMATLREGRATSVSWELRSGSDDRALLVQVSALGDAKTVSGYTVSTVDVTATRRSRDVVAEAAMALGRPVTVERALQEASQQLRSALSCDAVAIAVADEDARTLRLAHQSWAAETPTALEQRLMPAWLEALAGDQVIMHASRDGIEMTAPMKSGDEVVGAVTISMAAPPVPQRVDEVQEMLSMIAAQMGTAIERASAIRRMIHKRRQEAVGEVAAGVAHELRNPLFGISSAAQLLRFRVKDDPVVEKNVGRILREVERLNSLATALLEYGRPTPPHLQAGDPDDVWDEVLQSQRGLLESRALLLQRARAEPAARCAIDAQQLSQALANLLANAADAAPAGTDLTLHSAVLPNGAWRCRLQNGGPVIPPEVLPRVFEMFFSTNGIGLALSQRIIEEHGGTLTLESRPELGTAATILLPPAGRPPQG